MRLLMTIYSRKRPFFSKEFQDNDANVYPANSIIDELVSLLLSIVFRQLAMFTGAREKPASTSYPSKTNMEAELHPWLL